MCLAVPGRVLNLIGDDPAFRSANVDFCGVRKTINLAFTPDVLPGDFVLVHVGFAISRIDEEEASRTFKYLQQIGALADEGIELPAQPAAEAQPA
ncbi:MAG TPA: HypC/HybG/HupF family hydrogenase formation chaperone [Bryobacteraceae bacterium]|jgi:hydrogenase expression/formation protein HypC|nr:HypC/HybG/HupF family hydrogenase formation chaperone [Bryobacteraceae bacterium]